MMSILRGLGLGGHAPGLPKALEGRGRIAAVAGRRRPGLHVWQWMERREGGALRRGCPDYARGEVSSAPRYEFADRGDSVIHRQIRVAAAWPADGLTLARAFGLGGKLGHGRGHGSGWWGDDTPPRGTGATASNRQPCTLASKSHHRGSQAPEDCRLVSASCVRGAPGVDRLDPGVCRVWTGAGVF